MDLEENIAEILQIHLVLCFIELVFYLTQEFESCSFCSNSNQLSLFVIEILNNVLQGCAERELKTSSGNQD